ncbi:MAG: acetylornithine transaminase [Armatimonadetes bacterium]|nr:acetylornithine transaminase [Armatimonadota bacterium]CUU37118.1 acetylornithine/N-succinyldiaminopimelate aminotransferase [Armatimonadetes bacterium DC]
MAQADTLTLQHTIWELDQTYVMPTYRRMPTLFVRGSGARLYDEQGNAYLDFLAGIAVCALGHCHPRMVRRLQQQAETLIHVSGLLLTEPVARLAQKLCTISGMERAFFCNSGAEACETAIKIIRKHANAVKQTPDYEILVLEGSFHGRTMGAVSATAQPKYQEPFKPLLPGFRVVPRNDIEALESAFSERTAGILLEPIQGESGIHPLSEEYLRTARALCDRYNALMAVDEVQSGIGRTGKWFAYQHTDVLPDLVAVAKGLGGGIPIGACLARGHAATLLQPGEHGSTFGGNPLATATALEVLQTIEDEDLLTHAARIGDSLRTQLAHLQSDGAPIAEIRGKGLMLGVQLTQPIARTVAQKAFEKRLIINAVGDWVLRLVPPLIITEADVQESVQILHSVFKEVSV